MSSICPKCKFLLICDTLHKDSIIECEDFKDNRNNQKTNADRIRSMSNEELAWELCRIQRMPFYKDDNDIDEYEVDCWAKWLKEEYKE